MTCRVGPYLVTTTLGQGTFGKVKLAKHEGTGESYAMKILDKGDIRANELTPNVRREIAIMKALNHRNIVNLREVLASKSKLYIVMELVQGGELFDLIEQRGEMSPADARSYFQQLVDGIEYCHRRGVFHRDLKPENLLLDENGTLKITDFGMSSMINTSKQGGNSNLLLYTAVGTPYYCAPEIVNGAAEGYRGEKVDAWSCGIILYLLLVGHLPFRNENMRELFEEITSSMITYPEWLDTDAVDLISKLLRRNPEERISLEETKNHKWFRVDYEHVSFDGNQLFGTSSTSASTTRGGYVTVSAQERPGSISLVDSMQPVSTSTTNSRESSQTGNITPISPMTPPSTPKKARAAHVKKPKLKDMSEYSDKELGVLVKDALAGKSEKKVLDTVEKLEQVEIDCADDLIFLASVLMKPVTFSKWLQEKSEMQDVTCMRLAAFFFENNKK